MSHRSLIFTGWCKSPETPRSHGRSSRHTPSTSEFKGGVANAYRNLALRCVHFLQMFVDFAMWLGGSFG